MDNVLTANQNLEESSADSAERIFKKSYLPIYFHHFCMCCFALVHSSVQFFFHLNMRLQLGIVKTKDVTSLTCHMICEHAEKLSAAVALCKVDNM